MNNPLVKLKMTEGNRKWWVLVAMSGALAMVFVDQTAIAVALPQMRRDLGLSALSQQWVINAYMLSLATCIIMGGKMGDLIGRRKAFLTGLGIFVVASVSSAMAQAGWWIVLSRAVQGVGGALMIPTISATLMAVFPNNERGKAMGYFVAIASIFLSLGPFLGGILTQYLSWRWVFWINFPIALISIGLTLYVSRPQAKSDKKIIIDWWGFVLQAIAIGALVIALMEVADQGWSSVMIQGLLLLGVVGFAAFIAIEAKTKEPLVDLQVFRDFTFSRCVLLVFVMQAALICFIFWTIFLQMIMGYSPAVAGLLTLPATLPVLFMAPVGGRARDLYGPRLPVTFGSVMVIISAVWIAYGAYTLSYLIIFPAFILCGLGVPCIIANTFTTGLAEVSADKRGVAAGILNAARQLGGSTGLAVIGYALLQTYRAGMTEYVQATGGVLKKIPLDDLLDVLADPARLQQEFTVLTASQMKELTVAAKSAYVDAFSSAMLMVAALAAVGFVLALTLPRGRS